MEEGEERRLRGELRRMEARRSAVERCGLVRTALSADGGVAQGIGDVQAHVQGILLQEEAAAAQARGASRYHAVCCLLAARAVAGLKVCTILVLFLVQAHGQQSRERTAMPCPGASDPILGTGWVTHTAWHRHAQLQCCTLFCCSRTGGRQR